MYLAAAVVGIAVIPVGTSAHADGMPRHSQDGWVDTVQPALDAIRDVAATDPSYAAIRLDTAEHAVVVYRKHGGQSSRYSATRLPAGTRLEFRPAPLTESETYQLIDAIHRQEDVLAGQGIKVETVTSEWTGPVTITVARLTAEASDLPNRFNSYGPGTVVVEQNTRHHVKFNRDYDWWPFYGGAHIISAAWAHKCTSGFTGLSYGNGARYMITAAHCVYRPDPRFWTSIAGGGSGGSYIGRATVIDDAHDIAYIKVDPSKGTGPYIWDGPIYPKYLQFVKRVIGMRKPYAGMTNICTSGAYSGARCYATVKGGGWVGGQWLWWADSNDGDTAMAGDGDSGGPVFVPRGDNVYAVGMISGGAPDWPALTCGGDVPDNHSCSIRVYFADVYTEACLNHDIDLTK